jgi:hypothetical protein
MCLKHFPIQYGSNKEIFYGHFFSTSFRVHHENQVQMKLNGTHPVLLCADDANPLGGNINIIKKGTEKL